MISDTMVSLMTKSLNAKKNRHTMRRADVIKYKQVINSSFQFDYQEFCDVV